MLVLSRKPGQSILIGPNISLTIVRIGPNAVRIGIEAPRGVNIVRTEVGQVRPDAAPDAAGQACREQAAAVRG